MSLISGREKAQKWKEGDEMKEAISGSGDQTLRQLGKEAEEGESLE